MTNEEEYAVATAWQKQYDERQKKKSVQDRGEKSNPYFTFKGRATRREYWGKTLFLAFLIVVIATPLGLLPIFAAASRYRYQYSDGEIACFVGSIAITAICGLAMWPVTVRRLHDRSMSGWWILLFAMMEFVPFIGWIVGLVQFIIVGCLDGIPGPNIYGPDPKGRSSINGMVGAAANNAGAVRRDLDMTSLNLEGRLAELDKLKRRGLISKAEYRAKRSRIIAEL